MHSMKRLYNYISSALTQYESTEARYNLICHGLVQYQEEFPFYFRMVLDKINIDFENGDYLSEEKETYQWERLWRKRIRFPNHVCGERNI